MFCVCFVARYQDQFPPLGAVLGMTMFCVCFVARYQDQFPPLGAVLGMTRFCVRFVARYQDQFPPVGAVLGIGGGDGSAGRLHGSVRPATEGGAHGRGRARVRPVHPPPAGHLHGPARVSGRLRGAAAVLRAEPRSVPA